MDAPHIALWFTLLTGGVASAQPAVFRPGPEVTTPFVVAKTTPNYSEEARTARLEGSVLLSLVVGADGQPRDIQVVRALGLGLDESAVKSLHAWQFKPGTRNGTPVDVQVNEEVFFHTQRTLWDWHVVRVVFQPPDLATRPVILRVKFPPTVNLEQNASVTIAFNVGANGAPAALRVVKSSQTGWEAELLAAVRDGWRFRPALLRRTTSGGSRPTSTAAWIEFVRGSHSPIPPAAIPPAASPMP